jgi:hypothetical protein
MELRDGTAIRRGPIIVRDANDDFYVETRLFQPVRDRNNRVTETETRYVERMRSTVLPDWPADVLKEWLYRHADCISKYAFLDFQTFAFSRETWPLDVIPDKHAFDEEHFCDFFSNVEERAKWPYDWLAIYMCREGTWNTPIIMLENQGAPLADPFGKLMKQPFHLLEGHRRLAFLNGLRQRGKAIACHDVWIVRKALERGFADSAE